MTKTGKNKRAVLFAAAVALAYAGLLFIHLQIQPYSDDIWFGQMAKENGLLHMVGVYYMDWSGRVASTTLTFILMNGFFWLWRIVNPLVLLLLCVNLARIAAPKPGRRMLVFSFLLVLLLGPGILDYGAFWATGSLFYLWPITAALWLLLPFVQLHRQGGRVAAGTPAAALGQPPTAAAPQWLPLAKKGVAWFPLRVVLALLCGMCNEQLSLCITGFMGVILLEAIIKTGRLPGRFLALFFCSVASAAVLFCSPGGQRRFAEESANYAAAHGVHFSQVPLADKLASGVAWMYDGLFGMCVCLVLLLFGLCWYRCYIVGRTGFAAKQPLPQWPLFAVLGLAVGLLLPWRMDAMFAFADIRTGFAAGATLAQRLLVLAPYVVWTLVLACLFYLLAKQGWLAVLALVAALCTVVVLFFSPMLLLSGERTLMVAGLLLVVLALAQLKNRVPTPLLLFTACLAVYSAARLYSRLQLFM